MRVDIVCKGFAMRTVLGEVRKLISHLNTIRVFDFSVLLSPSNLDTDRRYLRHLFCILQPTGTSTKFANMMHSAVEKFAEDHGVQFDQVTKIPLEGEGKIERRVQKYV